jgi:serpin B
VHPFVVPLHHAIAADQQANVCWSRYSVAHALHLLAAEAGGLTRDELVAALLGDKAADLGALAAVLTAASELSAPEYAVSPELAVAATLWADPSLAFAIARDAPFLSAPDQARTLINDDVAATTRGLITNLIDTPPAGAVSALVSALYLKCGWVEVFEESDTAPAKFRTPAGKKQVPTMRLVSDDLGYAVTEDWQVVSLPAFGGVRAVVLVPYGDLARFEPALTADTFAELLAAPVARNVDLRLPKFTVSTRTELTEPLEHLGVRTAFTTDADLGDLGPALDSVPHQSVLTVTEEGIEGAAATAAIAWLSGTAEKPVVVKVERPFLFAVQHVATGVLYFLARITDPVT